MECVTPCPDDALEEAVRVTVDRYLAVMGVPLGDPRRNPLLYATSLRFVCLEMNGAETLYACMRDEIKRVTWPAKFLVDHVGKMVTGNDEFCSPPDYYGLTFDETNPVVAYCLRLSVTRGRAQEPTMLGAFAYLACNRERM